MDELSTLDALSDLGDVVSSQSLGRREFGKGALAAGVFPFGLLQGLFGSKPDCPLQVIREKRFDTLTAILSAQIDSLWCGRQGDHACHVANDLLRYASHLPYRMQLGLKVALCWLDLYSIKYTARKLHHHTHEGVRSILNQGETPRHKGSPPLILWDEDHLLHMAVSGIAMLGRLIIHSRNPARQLIGLGWSETCEEAKNLVSLPAPPLANLREHYDVVVIGSGAGGATIATRLTAQGRKVLILDIGDFVSPDALIQQIPQPDGSVKLAPPRSDEVLAKLYKGGGGQISGGLGKVNSKIDLVLPHRRRKIPVRQTINICQAQVFGGGPYVNNAIHLPIPQEVYDNKWAERKPTGVDYEQLSALMNGISNELGVNTFVTETQISDRSMRFAKGCQALGEEVQPLPVAMRVECSGCGSDNSVDSFGDHIGGLHPYAPGGANSFLVQAMHNPEPARVSYRTEAKQLRIGRDAAGEMSVTGLDVSRVEDNGCRAHATVTADEYVVAAGIGPTTRLVAQGLKSAGCGNRDLGKRFSANVGTAVYAMFDKPIWPNGSSRPEPGVTQCFIVDRRMVEKDGELLEEPALENWFHFPGTVALALTGWFKQFACTMRKFNHLSMSGIVVPTQVRDSNYVDACGDIHIEVDCDEFELLLRGIRRIARIYFASADADDGVTLHLPTKAMLLRGGRQAVIRDMDDLEWALCEIRRRGPAFVNLVTTHGQGGATLGEVVDPQTFQVKTDCGGRVNNLTVGDASLFPAGCEINPQLTLKALATLAAEQILTRTSPETV
ncbi:GMC family oxidoreductase N-terminal domain-containing protein [Stieleria sp. TO1_6]|uniref:GMC family oxidoreductase N-terminal domain-containing protein n=1 Tax=Stieleria tagensis TaxID=2956795 RepID=UPI00209BAFBF|nr:GMC family oxidoreductase N-terminal domain-containing protein [Stieleria tagensis]MCO8121044.1 GMC family oxidoreductase N-terminal domain-containing protein [Stieleria tagensis]